MKRFNWVFVILAVIIFGFVSFATRRDYGWNWDESQQYIRGQAYLRYLTGGKTSSVDVQPYRGRESIYEKNLFDITWLTKVIGHPPTTDIILASVNQLFFKRLGWLNDLESYRIYGVFLTFIAALVVGVWSYEITGWFGGVISVTAFYSFPLLFSEQHFNFKDPAVMAYNTVFLYIFWLGITRRKSILLLLSALVGGISLGTKFNILFLAPVICLWLFWYEKGWPRMRAILILIPVIMIAVLFFTYPLLWSDTWNNLKGLIDYYRQVGGNRCPYMPLTGLWFTRCTDWNTVRLFIVTIPIPTLLLSAVGSVAAVASLGKYKLAPFLWFVVLAGIVIRVVFPINSLYGESLRQVLEFIGPMALLAGFGAVWLVRRFPGKLTALFLLILYAGVFWNMWKLHPNENLYTNFLRDIFWKNDTAQFINGIVSYGNAYKQGVDWINNNAQRKATVSLVSGLQSAVPASVFRRDLSYGLEYWSGYGVKGEYLLELVSPEGHQTQFFPYKYSNVILNPVYEGTVSGYPIVRVWINDTAHTKSIYRGTVVENIAGRTGTVDEVVLQLSDNVPLRELITATNDEKCRASIMNSYVLVSSDGRTYRRMYESVEEMNRSTTGPILYPFAGDMAKFIKLFTYFPVNCDFSDVRFQVTAFK